MTAEVIDLTPIDVLVEYAGGVDQTFDHIVATVMAEHGGKFVGGGCMMATGIRDLVYKVPASKSRAAIATLIAKGFRVNSQSPFVKAPVNVASNADAVEVIEPPQISVQTMMTAETAVPPAFLDLAKTLEESAILMERVAYLMRETARVYGRSQG